MQQGASMNSAQILHTISRGKTNRLSADAILEFFRPLETWLMQQNRNEIVIGWNSNMEDVELFQLMYSKGHQTIFPSCTVFVVSIYLLKGLLLVFT